ncbi:VanZ family protein [Pelagibius sp. 7325]|uniref:VanZ family protein n=1 Tax=Pelagibius sp. 7325 TaxID=3131994 RepID=UPI0030EE64BC
MRIWLWLASLAVVVFLSLWPFRFRPALATHSAWLELAASWGWRTDTLDAAGNIALFVPVGVLGMLALRRLAKPWRAAAVIGLAFAVAVAAQAAQVIIPVRTATLVDVFWNMVGLLPALALGLLPWSLWPQASALRARLRVLPWLILAVWITYRLVPFVPTSEWELMRENLLYLAFEPEIVPPLLVVNTAAWLAAGFLMQAGDGRGRLDLLLPLLMVLVMALEVVIVVGGGLTADNLAGGLLALVLWFGVGRRLVRPALLVLPLLACAVLVNGLWPFAFAPRLISPFNWIPFAALMDGGMPGNLLALTYKFYLYAAACIALHALVRRWRVTAAGAAAFVLAVEVAQCFQPWHVPDITDPLVVLFACVVGAAFTSPPAPARVANA